MRSTDRDALATLDVPPAAPGVEPSDEALLARFARSDPDGAAAFVRRFERRVYGLAHTIVGASAADDVAQQALVKVWQHADGFDARRGTVSAWVMTITRNVAIDTLRSQRAVTVPLDVLDGFASGDPDPAEVAGVRGDVEWLRTALLRLPDEQRRAVVLAGVWGLTAREIAARDGIPLGTAKTRIRIALTRLRESRQRERTDGAARTVALPFRPSGAAAPGR